MFLKTKHISAFRISTLHVEPKQTDLYSKGWLSTLGQWYFASLSGQRCPSNAMYMCVEASLWRLS